MSDKRVEFNVHDFDLRKVPKADYVPRELYQGLVRMRFLRDKSSESETYVE